MDNIPNWELGALVQLRDMVRTLRNNISRSQSQSTENLNLVNAEGCFISIIIHGFSHQPKANTKRALKNF